jgi:hypothetical protein
MTALNAVTYCAEVMMRAGGGGGGALPAICATSRVCWRCVGAKFAAFAVGAFARTIGVARRACARAHRGAGENGGGRQGEHVLSAGERTVRVDERRVVTTLGMRENYNRADAA